MSLKNICVISLLVLAPFALLFLIRELLISEPVLSKDVPVYRDYLPRQAREELQESLNLIFSNEGITLQASLITPLDPKNLSAQQKEGLQKLDTVVLLYANYRDAWYQKGVVYGLLGDFSVSKSCFEKAVKIDLRFAEGFMGLGHCLRKIGNPEAAREAYMNALAAINRRVEDAPDPKKKLNDLLNKGLIHVCLGNHRRAIRALQEVMEKEPNQTKIQDLVRKIESGEPLDFGFWGNGL